MSVNGLCRDGTASVFQGYNSLIGTNVPGEAVAP